MDFNPFGGGGFLGLGSTGNDPGALGTGQYQYSPYQVDQGAFQNPAGNFAPQLQQALGSYTTNAAPQVTAATSPYTTQGAGGLGTTAGLQYGLATGTGPSLANVQAQQQGATNLAQAQALLGSARGAGSPGAAQLSALNALQGGQQQVAANAVQGRTAEELGAISGLGSTYGALAGVGQTQQGQQNQIALANQAATAAAQNQYLQALQAQNTLQAQGLQAGQTLGSQNALGGGQIQSGAYQSAAANNAKLAGSVISGAGAAIGALALL